jgi:hypothetical protein
VFGLQRIAARDNPPDRIKSQALQRCFGNVQVAAMGGVETSAEQADAAAGSRAGQARAFQGRTWPAPRTAYL